MTGCGSAEVLLTAEFLAPYLGLNFSDMTEAQIASAERAGKTAVSLVEAYLKYPITHGSFTQTENYLRTASAVMLNRMPIVGVDIVYVDGKKIDKSNYTLDAGQSVLKFKCCMSFRTLVIEGEAGYCDLDCMPADLKEALASIAVGVYNRGASLAMPSAADTALKSLTMFDAMSMTFDQAGSIEALSPQKLVEQWAFVLNNYRLTL